MSYSSPWRICQFCRKSSDTERMVKYGVRHYAHFGCYLDRKPLHELHAWQVRQFPWRELDKRGLLAEVEQYSRSESDWQIARQLHLKRQAEVRS